MLILMITSLNRRCRGIGQERGRRGVSSNHSINMKDLKLLYFQIQCTFFLFFFLFNALASLKMVMGSFKVSSEVYYDFKRRPTVES